MQSSLEAVHEAGLRAVLAGELTLGNASELHALLVSRLAETDHLVLDLSAVTAVDLTAAQLVIAAHRQALASGKRLELAAGPSPAVRRLWEALGLPGAELAEIASRQEPAA